MNRRTIVSALAVALSITMAGAQPAFAADTPAPQRHKDPLWNGIVIGAGLGAIVGALAGTAIVDCDECAGFNVPLTFGVVGAAAGAGIGAGLDALRHSRKPAVSTVRRPVTVVPVVRKRLQAVVAVIRF